MTVSNIGGGSAVPLRQAGEGAKTGDWKTDKSTSLNQPSTANQQNAAEIAMFEVVAEQLAEKTDENLAREAVNVIIEGSLETESLEDTDDEEEIDGDEEEETTSSTTTSRVKAKTPKASRQTANQGINKLAGKEAGCKHNGPEIAKPKSNVNEPLIDILDQVTELLSLTSGIRHCNNHDAPFQISRELEQRLNVSKALHNEYVDYVNLSDSANRALVERDSVNIDQAKSNLKKVETNLAKLKSTNNPDKHALNFAEKIVSLYRLRVQLCLQTQEIERTTSELDEAKKNPNTANLEAKKLAFDDANNNKLESIRDIHIIATAANHDAYKAKRNIQSLTFGPSLLSVIYGQRFTSATEALGRITAEILKGKKQALTEKGIKDREALIAGLESSHAASKAVAAKQAEDAAKAKQASFITGIVTKIVAAILIMIAVIVAIVTFGAATGVSALLIVMCIMIIVSAGILIADIVLEYGYGETTVSAHIMNFVMEAMEYLPAIIILKALLRSCGVSEETIKMVIIIYKIVIIIMAIIIISVAMPGAGATALPKIAIALQKISYAMQVAGALGGFAGNTVAVAYKHKAEVSNAELIQFMSEAHFHQKMLEDFPDSSEKIYKDMKELERQLSKTNSESGKSNINISRRI